MKSYSSGLTQFSKCYYDSSNIYAEFCQCEDYPGLVFNALVNRVQDKQILDYGCGTGKYTFLLSPFANSILGVDCSGDQLRVAKKRAADLPNVKFQLVDPSMPVLPTNTFDIVLMTWVLGTVLEIPERIKILTRITDSLKENGNIILIENDVNSEFERIRGKTDNPLNPTDQYNNWLETTMNFSLIERFDSYFLFPNKQTAKTIFNNIWGITAAAKIGSRKIGHSILMYETSKDKIMTILTRQIAKYD